MTFRIYRPVDYPALRDWRKSRGMVCPHESWLAMGVVAFNDSVEKICMGFIDYSATVGVGHLDWFASRPGLTPGQAQEAIDGILSQMESTGKSLFPGPFVMLGCVQSQAMANRARKSGFTPLGQCHMIAKGVEPWPQQQSQSSVSSDPQ